jgi:hypothetical protein
MPLKVRGITNDSVARVAVITFSDVLDERPQISATIDMVTAETQTQAEVNMLVKARIRALLAEALRLCD